ncbi:hypothetical protein [Eubacterium aggregans]|uniref:hypothetical protein n=1 Tax=Eubacterium aggregans TaxID=81409 RepID=UPI003F3E51B5
MNESLELLKRAEVYQLDCYLAQDSSLANWGRASDYFLETSSFRESEYAYLKYIEDANEVNLVATGQNYTICFLNKSKRFNSSG